MGSIKLSARVTDLGVAQAIEAALAGADPPLYAVTLFEDGPGAWRVEGYSQVRGDAEAAAATVAAEVADAPPLQLEDVPDLNWVAISQAALPPVVAGRFVVHGSHDRGRIPYGPRAILVDAGEAFGTAHHGTTLGCLLAIDRLARNRGIRRVLDLGCGSGVLAIAAARAFTRAQIMASDNDPIAVEVARANADANSAGRIVTACAMGLDHPWLRQGAPYDLIIANLLAGPLRALSGAVASSVRRGGYVVLSGILNPEAPAVIAAYVAHGFLVLKRRQIGDWTTLTLRRRA
jgi:ribosomal protein L11 methyltransferase